MNRAKKMLHEYCFLSLIKNDMCQDFQKQHKQVLIAKFLPALLTSTIPKRKSYARDHLLLESDKCLSFSVAGTVLFVTTLFKLKLSSTLIAPSANIFHLELPMSLERQDGF